MKLVAGTYRTLEVAREVPPYGYFLTDRGQTEEVLLHYSEKKGDVAPGQRVDVFLFYDTQDRLAATMKEPHLALGETALLEVVDRHARFGLFLDMGLGRNLLLPFAEQPEMKELRPQVGDRVFVYMDHDRQGRLIARLAGEEQLVPLAVRAPESWKGAEWREARVYKPLQEGTFVVIDGGVLGFGVLGFIHTTERTRLLRVGETVRVRVAFVRPDGRVNASTRPPKEVGRDEDAERILAFLRERPNGAMPYSDATAADVIMQKFGISKAAFKRALGKLMKQGEVEQRENWTHLATKREESSE
ncbi:CvfB family protein [Paenibacillus cymbidii]|uniref:CvfB family protein n=1 Tax=Paenibacillus cymbidii TaxID=1639034 RepID=UPI001081DAE8|nr:S1-like domain-containing RNA-binding protein [Paenibacillus cymbidii]